MYDFTILISRQFNKNVQAEKLFVTITIAVLIEHIVIQAVLYDLHI